MEQSKIEYKIVKELREKDLTVFTAESCTGGLICKLLTDVCGASSCVKGGVVCYVNEIKTDILGVSKETIKKYTEVSEQCAYEMALGARKISGADVGLSTTGYASDGDNVPSDMVGVIYLGVAYKDDVNVYRVKLEGDRDKVRNDASRKILELLYSKFVLGEREQ